MKRETVLKILLVLTVGIMLFALPVNVFAADAGFDDFWDDQGGLNDIQPEPENQPETQPQPEPEKQPETKPQPEPEKKPEQQKPTTDIPKAGLVEDTMMFVGITVLGITAVYAYKKVNEYKNI